jgi:hypothetical protein
MKHFSCPSRELIIYGIGRTVSGDMLLVSLGGFISRSSADELVRPLCLVRSIYYLVVGLRMV